MFLIYTIDAENPRTPTERVVHCVDTDLADRTFVVGSIQSDRAVKRLVDQLDDFIGDQTKDLRKPLLLLGIDGDAFGARVIGELIKAIPRYVTIKYATVNRVFR